MQIPDKLRLFLACTVMPQLVASTQEYLAAASLATVSQTQSL